MNAPGPRVLRRGLEGADVRVLQVRLNLRGLVGYLLADGVYGPNTEAAVRVFQRHAGLKPDGVFGPLTRQPLDALHRS